MNRRKAGLKLGLAVVLALCAATEWSTAQGPYSGYVYPAGGQQDSVFQVIVGGQRLAGVSGVHVSGSGVGAWVVEYVRPMSNTQISVANRHARVLVRLRQAEERKRRLPKTELDREKFAAELAELPELVDHPWLRGMPAKSIEELRALQRLLYNPKRQPNSQLAETVIVEISIDATAEAGEREMRLLTSSGPTNPVRFLVGRVPEIREPNPLAAAPPDPPLAVPPAVLNGQIMPGETDSFRIQAQQGQKLVIAAHARSLIPYLADAVPGWFQATLSLHDPEGDEVAFADDYRFDPDPVMFYEVPEDGEYLLDIRDAIYRGREDFVYRVTVGEQPFITQMFPLGGPAGVATVASVAGWNLPWDEVTLDTEVGDRLVREVAWTSGEWGTNRLLCAVGDLPETTETEPADTLAEAQRIELPQIINGRITSHRDVDVFAFEGNAGDEVVARVDARVLGSPLDSLLRLTDASGTTLALNDDHMEKDGHLHTGPGLITHHADSYLSASLPAQGTYYVHLSDVQRHGGDEYCYRLRIGPPRANFAIRLVPSSISVPAGRDVAVTAYVAREDGFDGEIEVAVRDAPEGFAIHGGRIPAGQNKVRMTLSAPAQRFDEPVSLELEGRVQIGEKTLTRPVIPADRVMQAFLWEHLLPARTLVAMVTDGRRYAPRLSLTLDQPVQIPAGGTVEVQVAVTHATKDPVPIRLTLNGPPEGVSLQKVAATADMLTLVLKAEADNAGDVGNLIVDAAATMQFKAKDGTMGKKRQIPLGTLPAIPFAVMAQ